MREVPDREGQRAGQDGRRARPSRSTSRSPIRSACRSGTTTSLVLADQRDNWAVAESSAKDLGGGRYRWTLPAGSTDADITRIRATTSTTAYLAHGFASIDQRSGGLVKPASTCRSRRVVNMNVKTRLSRTRKIRRLTVFASAGKVRLRRTASGYKVRLDLRRVKKGTVKVRLVARTNRGIVRQTRTYRTCAKRTSR